MAADSYLNVLVFFDSIFKGSPRSVSSTNGTVETFFYDWVSLSYLIFYFIFCRTNSTGVFHIRFLSIWRPHLLIEGGQSQLG